MSDLTGPSAYFFAYLGCAVALVFASKFRSLTRAFVFVI